MDLSSGGRIVVIDDVRAEVEQLLITLGRNGIPCLYFSGEIAALPMAPLTGIRFVILDIELAGMDGQDDKTKASAVAGVLEKVISKANGPFVILFWTLHGEVKEQVLEYSKAKGIIPVASVDLDKAACTNSANPVQSITEALNRELASVVAFQVYVEWENVVDQSTRQFVFDFSSLVPLGAKWSAQTAEICYRLYKSVVGKHELPTQQERFKCACHLMNRSYLDTLERFTDSQLKLPTGISITSGVLSDETTAKLNSSLFLSQPIADRRGSGYVYKVENQPLHGTLKKRLFKAESVPENTMLCGVILTPACDIAEKKTLCMGENDTIVHRIVYGLLYPMTETYDAEKKKIVDNRAREVFGPVWWKDQTSLFVMHFASLSTLPENELVGDAIFMLGLDWLSDLQRLAASHVNRLGRLSIKSKE